MMERFALEYNHYKKHMLSVANPTGSMFCNGVKQCA